MLIAMGDRQKQWHISISEEIAKLVSAIDEIKGQRQEEAISNVSDLEEFKKQLPFSSFDVMRDFFDDQENRRKLTTVLMQTCRKNDKFMIRRLIDAIMTPQLLICTYLPSDQ